MYNVPVSSSEKPVFESDAEETAVRNWLNREYRIGPEVLHDFMSTVKTLHAKWPPPEYTGRGHTYRIQFFIDHIKPVAETGWLLPSHVEEWKGGFKKGMRDALATEEGQAALKAWPDAVGSKSLENLMDVARGERGRSADALLALVGVDTTAPVERTPDRLVHDILVKALPKPIRETHRGPTASHADRVAENFDRKASR